MTDSTDNERRDLDTPNETVYLVWVKAEKKFANKVFFSKDYAAFWASQEPHVGISLRYDYNPEG